MDGPGSWRCAVAGIFTRSEGGLMVNGPLTPALSLGEREPITDIRRTAIRF